MAGYYLYRTTVIYQVSYIQRTDSLNISSRVGVRAVQFCGTVVDISVVPELLLYHSIIPSRWSSSLAPGEQPRDTHTKKAYPCRGYVCAVTAQHGLRDGVCAQQAEYCQLILSLYRTEPYNSSIKRKQRLTRMIACVMIMIIVHACFMFCCQ